MPEAAARGRRPMPGLGDAALNATIELLIRNGYDGLRMREVAAAAGVGLGALYRRWPSKQQLVLDALQAMADDTTVEETDDPVADLVAGLVVYADGLRRGVGGLLASLLADPTSELSLAITKVKVVPFRAAHRERLRRVVGDVEDLDTRADIGPALVNYAFMVNGHPPTDEEIATTMLTAMTGLPTSASVEA